MTTDNKEVEKLIAAAKVGKGYMQITKELLLAIIDKYEYDTSHLTNAN